ncbi:MAG: RNA-binding S4 domain-containing protein [Bacillota bacterium]
MRLDKFLKVSRIIKRRTVAKEISDAGHIRVNDRKAKSSTKIEIGDIIALDYANKTLTLEVKDLRDSVKKDDATSLYKVLDESYKDKE